MTGNDIIENERRRKNNGKLLKFVLVAIIFFLLGSVIFLTVHCTKFECEIPVLVATAAAASASNDNITASNTYDDICPGFTCSTNDTANDCVNETIQSNCTVTNRNYNESDCNYNGEDIKLHFIISYTSSICNVTYFPEIFQNYTNGHHNKTLDNLNLFKMNSITNIDKVRRVSNSSITSEMTNTTP
ncbi:hypothetical protein FRACYDRAFT_238286 [Fragilariopsis cylindrus CCMP1102]|uniref:Uncharacterized protein n=1 Tax=Fragilariopsis cylindrus CCMP1102 TaxID=635003 RepID=A0A1E7FI74_9STRA|nr:hypothetical protein FRACYDRAFT_238286 [Fragilariopsis cylindrus CCMP1102]|eukprot:OEU17858.1 hypothetical protein FRACYDRAFT_238286 [Fragilariopsis cylindrus CCMP1102]